MTHSRLQKLHLCFVYMIQYGIWRSAYTVISPDNHNNSEPHAVENSRNCPLHTCRTQSISQLKTSRHNESEFMYVDYGMCKYLNTHESSADLE